VSVSSAPVLVTGASGFIGRHLVEALLARGLEVGALCRPASVLPQRWGASVARIDCEDWSQQGLADALGEHRFECLFHLAAYGVVPTDRDSTMMLRINAEMPVDLVRLCERQGAAMVMAGSSAEYRRPDGRQRLTETSPLETEKTYGASKARGTTQACALANEAGVPLRVLRLFNVYGPGEPPHRLLPSLVSGLAANQRIALSEGSQVRDFVYVGDVVEALLAAADHLKKRPDTPAAVWNVATEEGHTVREFAQITARLFGGAEQCLGFGDLPMRPDDIEYLVGRSALIQAQTGWAPRHDLAAGIAASLAHMTGASTRIRAAQ
jgi:nucleoside-diphosphate-sugar epimerase